MTGTLPLLAARNLQAPLAWRDGVPLSGQHFLDDVQHLATRLCAAAATEAETPAPLINLCLNRWSFAVGLGAALQRGQLSLLPPNALPDTLGRLHAVHPGATVLADAPLPAIDIPQILWSGTTGATNATDPAPLPRAAADQAATCLLTSGSTGQPQPHTKRWGELVTNIGAAAERLAWHLERPTLAGLNIVATVPAQHSYGLESSVLLALLGGAAFDEGRPFYPADIAAALARLPRPRALVTTPFHLKTLLLSGAGLPRVDLVLCATAPLSPQLAAQAERVFGGPLVEIYGCTEAGQIASRRTVASDVWETFGSLRLEKAPASGDEAKCWTVQGGHVAEPTALSDVLDLLDARRFRLLGRANDIIHVAGKRSSLSHLNHHLNSIDGVVDGSFWLPGDVADGVVRPVAFVVAPSLDATAVLAALRQRIEPMFLPRRVVHVDALPRAATGKLTAEALRDFAAARLRGSA